MSYQTIVADPPWPLGWRGGAIRRRNGRGEVRANRQASVRALPYPTMTIESISGLAVEKLAAANAHLYLWVPDYFAIRGVADVVARAWGFTPGRFLVWHKTVFGLGTFPRPQHELCLVAKRGRPSFGIRDRGSVHRWPSPSTPVGARQHSAKPDGFYDLVEAASPGPYLDLFARRQRLGWDTWGDEALCHVDLGVAEEASK